MEYTVVVWCEVIGKDFQKNLETPNRISILKNWEQDVPVVDGLFQHFIFKEKVFLMC
jgi:hypothetical protein